MSKYGEFITTISDEKALVEALKDLGMECEVHAEARELSSWHGKDAGHMAHVIVRRDNVKDMNSLADVGFFRDPSGSYRLIVDDFKFNADSTSAWMARVKQTYQERRQINVAKTKGYIFQGREVVKTAAGQRVRLSFGVR
jgi:hypothetical protein